MVICIVAFPSSSCFCRVVIFEEKIFIFEERPTCFVNVLAISPTSKNKRPLPLRLLSHHSSLTSHTKPTYTYISISTTPKPPIPNHKNVHPLRVQTACLNRILHRNIISSRYPHNRFRYPQHKQPIQHSFWTRHREKKIVEKENCEIGVESEGETFEEGIVDSVVAGGSGWEGGEWGEEEGFNLRRDGFFG